MSSQPLTFVTPEEYLAAERKAERKSEYINGEVFAMAGVSPNHDDIVSNLGWSLNNQLRNGDCKVHTPDFRVRVNPKGAYMYTYPDVSVVCGEPRFEDGHLDTLLNPKVIIEVLSHSTEKKDRGVKAELYRQLASHAEYLLVAQDRVHVEHYVRQPDGNWLLAEFNKLEDAVELRSVGATLKLGDIYHRVAIG
jgi:Uma2 family endonuclease